MLNNCGMPFVKLSYVAQVARVAPTAIGFLANNTLGITADTTIPLNKLELLAILFVDDANTIAGQIAGTGLLGSVGALTGNILANKLGAKDKHMYGTVPGLILGAGVGALLGKYIDDKRSKSVVADKLDGLSKLQRRLLIINAVKRHNLLNLSTDRRIPISAGLALVALELV